MRGMNDWFKHAQAYLQRLGQAEYQSGLRAHVKQGRSPKTYRHNPSEYHRELVDLLGKDDEHGFKSLKGMSGYSSSVGS